MALRMMNYGSSVLLNYARAHPKETSLPSLIGMIYYHGERRPYPHTTNIADLILPR